MKKRKEVSAFFIAEVLIAMLGFIVSFAFYKAELVNIVLFIESLTLIVEKAVDLSEVVEDQEELKLDTATDVKDLEEVKVEEVKADDPVDPVKVEEQKDTTEVKPTVKKATTKKPTATKKKGTTK